jgi:hypothetical protein
MGKCFTPPKDRFEKYYPWITSVILLPVLLYYIFNRGEFTFLDYVNLLIHEGGHGIFRIFGSFMHTLGGTLMQIIIPSLFLVYYIIHRNKFGFQCSLFWLGESLMNISVYAADARARVLPLLGGNKVYHDWTWMLSRLNLLEEDILIGEIFYYTGVICFVVVLLAPLFIKKKEKQPDCVDLDLKI